MTNFMKLEVISFFVLRTLGYACGILGALGMLGIVGALETDSITIAQFWLYELGAIGLALLSASFYYIRMWIAKDLLARDRQLTKAKKVARTYKAKKVGT